MNKKEIRTILDKAKGKKLIAFDCFDTLVRRKYSINYVFFRLSGYLLGQYPLRKNFNQVFLSLQRILNRCDVSFESLAKDVYLHFEDDIPVDFLDFYAGFKTEFESAEKDNILATEGSTDLIRQLKKSGKSIYVISDFYIGKEFLEPVLVRLFGNEVFEDIIVSSDYGKTKQKGTLFSLLSSPKDVLMIGDNYESDFNLPKKLGFDCVHIDSCPAYQKYQNYDSGYIRNIQRNLASISSKKKLTFSGNYGFILYFCMKKLYQDLQKSDQVLFLARDGLFLKKCFDHLLKQENTKEIKTRYLPISRLALLVPSMNIRQINPSSLRQALEKRTPWPIVSNKKLLFCLGFHDTESQRLLDAFGNKIYNSSEDYFSGHEYLNLISSADFLEALQKIQLEAIEKLHDLLDNSEHIITVDLGWRGTSQNDLKKIIGKDTVLVGYYIGTTDCIGELEGSKKKGLWFDYLDDASLDFDSYYDLEALLKNKEKQLVSYRKDEDIYIEDTSTIVYEQFAKENQAIAFDVFNRLMVLDAKTPIPSEEIIKCFNKIKKKESFKDIFNGFYYYFLQDDGNMEKRSKKSLLIHSMNLYFSRRCLLLRKPYFFFKKKIKQKKHI